MSFKIDSGADVTVIPYRMYKSIGLTIPLLPTKKVLMGPCNYTLDVKGTFKIDLQHSSVVLWSPLSCSKLGGQGSSLGRTSTHGFKIIEQKGLPLH